MTLLRWAVRPAVLAAALSPLIAAQAQPAPAPPAIGTAPSHCIGDQPLPMVAGGPSAWLDETDRRQVLAALMLRYPTLQRDGLDADALLLWRHLDGDWRYAALIPDLRSPGRRCVAATFSASAVEATAALLRKYFFTGGDRS